MHPPLPLRFFAINTAFCGSSSGLLIMIVQFSCLHDVDDTRDSKLHFKKLLVSL
jgi:hypothetical protein